MKVTDVFCHVHTTSLVNSVSMKSSAYSPIETDSLTHIDKRINTMDEYGIDIQVLSLPRQLAQGNDGQSGLSI